MSPEWVGNQFIALTHTIAKRMFRANFAKGAFFLPLEAGLNPAFQSAYIMPLVSQRRFW
jgi:hypothetical protein